MAWRLKRAAGLAQGNGRQGGLTLYAGAVERFVVTLAGFAVGMGMLRLEPLAQIIGFAVAQLGYLAGARRHPPR